jgi:cytoskeleton protein RodZ
MATEALKKFAEELKSVRESKAISIQQIATKTRIDPKFLHAIEDADFDIMPDLYMRAFIKEYSSALNLDQAVVIQQYDNAKSNKQNEKLLVVSEIEQKVEGKIESEPAAEVFASSEEQLQASNSPVEAERISNTQLNFIVGGLVVIVALLIIYFAFIRNSSTEIITEKSEQDQIGNARRFEVENPNTSQNPTIAQPPVPDSLRLTVTTSDRVWVKVSTDGKIVQQGSVLPNSKLNYASLKSFSVTVGNAGVVKIFFNNKPVENIGKGGEIRNIFMSPETIKYYTIPPQTKNENKSPTKN